MARVVGMLTRRLLYVLGQHRVRSHSTSSTSRRARLLALFTKSVPTQYRSAAQTTDRDQVMVIGLGYVGLPLALLADSVGYRVVGLEASQARAHEIREYRPPLFLDEEARQMFSVHNITIGIPTDIVSTTVIVIAVPTPVSDTFTPDLRALVDSAEIIAQHIQPGTLVLVESTVSPGICEEVVLKTIVEKSGLVPDESIYFAHCPERVNPGDATYRVENLPRVIGAIGQRSLERALSFYRSIIDAPLYPMGSVKEAEAVKMVENAFRDVNIAFANELAMSFEGMGIDAVNVIKGAATKPFGFMPHYPGCGVGGHCIPVDPYYLIDHAARNGFEHRFLKAAREVNNAMPRYTVGLLVRSLEEVGSELAEAPVALLGLAYKRDVPDVRESPALVIRSALLELGVELRTYDPYLPEGSTHESLTSVLMGAKALILATDHTLFCEIDARLLRLMGIKVVVDGRNCLSKEAIEAEDILYVGIGR